MQNVRDGSSKHWVEFHLAETIEEWLEELIGVIISDIKSEEVDL